MIITFIALYVAYASVILIWCILGAVLNPQKFLPMAIGSLVFVAFSYRLYVKLTNLHMMIINRVKTCVDNELKQSLIETLQDHESRDDKEAIDTINQTSAINTFKRELNNYMEVNNYTIVDEERVDLIIKGDAEAILQIISKNHGVNSSIALGILGMIAEDPYLILDSTFKLCQDLGINPDVNLYIAEGVLNKHYLKKTAKHYRVVRPMTKKLIQKIFPDFPVTALDKVHSIITEGSIPTMIDICDNLKIPTHLFKIGYAFSQNNKVELKEAINEFLDSICVVKTHKENMEKLFSLLQLVNDDNIHKLSLDLLEGVIPESMLHNIEIATVALKGRKSLIQNALLRSTNNFDSSSRNPEESKTKLANHLLSLKLLN